MNTLLDGWTQCAVDRDGKLVRAVPSNRGNGWVLSSGYLASVPDKLESIAQGALFPYVGDEYAYHCPADARLHDSKQRAFRSYSISAMMHGLAEGHSRQFVRVDEIPNPALAQVFIEEPDPRTFNFGA